MGVALVLLGLLAAGLVVDGIVENWSSGASELSFTLLGGSFSLTLIELLIGAAVLGAVSVLFVVIGMDLLRGSWGRRRVLKRKVSDLERENEELRAGDRFVTSRDAAYDEPAVVPESEGAEARERVIAEGER